jgi:hypothetical protein
MYCQNCGTELRSEARFCRGCGAQVEARKKQRSSKPRLTVALPREAPPVRQSDTESGQQSAPAQAEDSLIVPIAEKPPDRSSAQKTPEPESEIVALTPQPHSELPQFVATSRVKRNIRERVEPPAFGVSRRQAESKPLIEHVLGSDPEVQQKRLIAIVPLVLLVVILLFVFAYYAVW